MVSKNIWIINHYAICPGEVGSSRTFDFARELVKKGHKVTIFAANFNHYANRYISTTRKNYEGVRFVWIKVPSYSGNGIKRIWNMLVFSLKVVLINLKYKRPDVIMGSSPHPFAALSALFISRLRRVNFLLEIRDLWPRTLIDLGDLNENSFITKCLHLIEKILYRSANKIFVLLPGAVEYITNLNISPEKVVYLPNGISLKDFDYKKNKYKKSLIAEHFLFHKFVVVYTGSLGLANKMDVIIEAARIVKERMIKDIHFLIVGQGPQRENLIRLSNDYNLDNITFNEPISKDYIPGVLSESDLQVISITNSPLYRYGISPNKMFDYMASGRPIIMAGNVLNDLVSIANAGFTVEPENPEAMADAIIKVYKMSPEERKKYGENGRVYVREHHELKILCERLEEHL